ncbi:hypothetical protein C8F01DRAFT_1307941 [Mycena amicta]|nr:hypothetical protein C8F01DRAFT_1307941 [Mycena amicta]
MHRCLQIPEIVLHIFSELYSQHTLAQLAQTCRLFSGPALDALWYQPGEDTILYLLRCLPEDMALLKTVSGQVVLELRRPAVLSDWERFQSYSNRVRVYDHSVRAYFGRAQAFASLALLLPGDLLFPRLDRLGWHVSGREGGSLFRLLLTPELRSIAFSGSRTMTLLSLLPIIVQRRLALCSFTLSVFGDELTSVDLRSLSLFVQTLSQITFLSLPSLDSETLEFLRTHRCLTTLEIESFPTDVSFDDPRNGSPSFQNLRNFSCDRADIPTMLRLLPLLCGPLLGRLIVHPTEYTTTKQMTAFYATVSTHCQPSCLLSIRVGDECPSRTEEPYHVELDAFRRLTRFTKLTSIRISTRGDFQFGDDIVEELARTCPALTDLRLRQFKRDSAFTLSILIRLAEHCKDLSFLDITVDTSVIPSIDLGPDTGEPLSHSALCKFSAGFSVVEDTSAVAHFLSSLFPSLSKVFSGHNEEAILSRRWAQVERLVLGIWEEEE